MRIGADPSFRSDPKSDQQREPQIFAALLIKKVLMTEERIFKIKIAELTVEMHSEFGYSEKKCADFITDSADTDIVAYPMAKPSRGTSENVLVPPKWYTEYIDLYRSIAEQLPNFGRFVFHGASVKAFGRGYVFTAPSGTGKSTHISLLMKHYKDQVSIINGDKPIICVKDGEAIVHSCPWAGKEDWRSNTSAPIGGMILLHRGLENRIRRIEPSEYFGELMKQIYIPQNGEMKLKALDLIDKLAKTVPFYLLECNISEEAAKTSFEIMKE